MKKKREIGKVKGAKATGSFILVEMLTEGEASGSKLVTSEKQSNQGYVLDIGPALDGKWGIKVGDRVLMQGTFTPVPKANLEDRDLSICDAHCIKCILSE